MSDYTGHKNSEEIIMRQSKENALLREVVDAAVSFRDEVEIMIYRSASKNVFNHSNVLNERMLFDKILQEYKEGDA